MGVTMAGTAFGISFLVNRFGPQLANVPGFKFISNVEKDGLLESSVGIILLSMVAMFVGRMLGIISRTQ